MEKIIIFIDDTNACSLGVLKVKNYDGKFDEAAYEAKLKAMTDTSSIDDLFPSIMEHLGEVGYKFEKLDYGEVIV